MFALLCCAAPAMAQEFADELPRIPPTEPEQALKTFAVADGFKMELVASEPLIGTPVAIEWDADGRMFVCEMRGYSEDRDEAISSIALLTDDDDDGRYDRRTTFAEGLLWPTAIFPYDGGLFVGDAPHLYYFKDTDGDGKADDKQLVLTGFGTSNVQGLMNSMRWGLDNRIHIACSSTGGQIRRGDAGENAKPINVRGRDISFDPRTYEFQPTSGAAQHGMCFDDWGRKFVSSNSDHIQQVMYEDHDIARIPTCAHRRRAFRSPPMVRKRKSIAPVRSNRGGLSARGYALPAQSLDRSKVAVARRVILPARRGLRFIAAMPGQRGGKDLRSSVTWVAIWCIANGLIQTACNTWPSESTKTANSSPPAISGFGLHSLPTHPTVRCT